MTTTNAAQLAQLLHGTLEGDPSVEVARPGQIEHAQNDELAFLDSAKYEEFAYTTKAGILLVSKEFVAKKPISATLIRVENVRESLMLLLQTFGAAVEKPKGERSKHCIIEATAEVADSVSIGHFSVVEAGAKIGEGTQIAEQVLIGKNVRIGKHCTIHAGVKIHHGCIIGDHCIIHSNAVIGTDGFGFAPQEDGSWKKVPQVGNVVLGDHVDIGANTCIDRAALGSTVIASGAKLDNLVHIAHNVHIGENTALAAQVGVAGSSKVGAQCLLGGQAGLAGHLTIAKGTKVQAQSGIASSIKEENTAVFGSPAIAYSDFVRAFIVFKKLPELEKRVRGLERKKDK